MKLKLWIIGGVLGASGVVSATGVTRDAASQDANSTQRNFTDAGTSHDASGGDSNGLTHSSSSSQDSSESSSSSTGSSGSSLPNADRGLSHHSNTIGWQSLLPGSIQ